MQYQPKTNQQPQSATVVAVLALIHRRIGGRIKASTYLTDRARTMTTAAWAEELASNLGTTEAAGQHIADAIQAFRLEIAPAPAHSKDRKAKCAAYAAQPRAAKPGAVLQEVMSELRDGKRIIADTEVQRGAAAIRDPKTGKVDVLATAKKYGLWTAAASSEEERSAKFDLQDLTARAAFGDLKGVVS